MAVICLVAVGVGVAVLAATPDATRLPPGGRAVPPMAVLAGWSFVGVDELDLPPALEPIGEPQPASAVGAT